LISIVAAVGGGFPHRAGGHVPGWAAAAVKAEAVADELADGCQADPACLR
jgi:hypothetical protein